MAPGLVTAARSLLTKLLLTPVVAVAGLLTSRIAIGSLGVAGFAVFSLVIGLAGLLPFADLGIGTAVMDAVARRDALAPGHLQGVMARSCRALMATALIIALIGWSLSTLGLWGSILGTPENHDIDQAAGWAVLTFALGLPLSLGPRALTGLGRNHIAVVLQAVGAVASLILVTIAHFFTTGLTFFTCAPFIGVLLSNLISVALIRRPLGLSLRQLARASLSTQASPYRIAHIAGPMAVITTVLPIAYQTDRLVLSHVSNLKEVARYSVAFQVFSPLMALVGTAGMALWPVYAQAREGGTLRRADFSRAQITFTAVGVALAAGLVALGPILCSIITGGRFQVPLLILISFSLLLTIQAASYPMAVLLTDSSGLRFQAALHLIMVAINLPISLALAAPLGAAGPVLASVGAIAASLFIPQFIRVRRILDP